MKISSPVRLAPSACRWWRSIFSIDPKCDQQNLDEAMKPLNQCSDQQDADMVIVMDEHQDREAILTRASQAMYGGPAPRRRIVKLPFQVKSERYQTCQCAD